MVSQPPRGALAGSAPTAKPPRG